MKDVHIVMRSTLRSGKACKAKYCASSACRHEQIGDAKVEAQYHHCAQPSDYYRTRPIGRRNVPVITC